MSLALRRSDVFVEDFETAYCWYLEKAGEAVARRFLESVWQALELLVASGEMKPMRNRRFESRYSSGRSA
jgi:hypothetical protein